MTRRAAGPEASDVIAAIHEGTALYTAPPEVEALLDLAGWPGVRSMIDPACGDGNVLVAALSRLRPPPGDHDAVRRVRGVEFHADSADRARERCAETLVALGWTVDEARRAGDEIVDTSDFLLDGVEGKWDAIVANPPYWRRGNLPTAYREGFDRETPPEGRADMLHAYLLRMARHLVPGGAMAVITSDRWLVNAGAAGLRAALGTSLGVRSVRRLDAASAFHRPKDRAKGTPPRVHAVSMLLQEGGRELGRKPFRMREGPSVDGVPLRDLVDLRLAPYLGPRGVFTVEDPAMLPNARLVPCVEPRDVDARTGRIGPTRLWAVVTGDERPCPEVLAHIDANLHRMPARGRRRVRWLPPERFDQRLPLDRDAVMVPRIATRLRAIALPRGHLPTNHSLVVVGGRDPLSVAAMLEDPRVQAQADALALRVEDGFKSYTATLLRQLVVPHDLLEEEGNTT